MKFGRALLREGAGALLGVVAREHRRGASAPHGDVGIEQAAGVERDLLGQRDGERRVRRDLLGDRDRDREHLAAGTTRFTSP